MLFMFRGYMAQVSRVQFELRKQIKDLCDKARGDIQEAMTEFAEAQGDDDDDTLEHPAIGSEEHTSELQSLMRISYALSCMKNKKTHSSQTHTPSTTRSQTSCTTLPHNKIANQHMPELNKTTKT